METRRKFALPDVFKLSGYRFDADRLKTATRDLQNQFTNVYKTDPRYFGQTKELAESAGDTFTQIHLTVFNEEQAGAELSPEAAAEEQGRLLQLSRSQRYRAKLNPVDPRGKEHNYNKPTPAYLGSYFEEVVRSFKAEAIRVRLARLPARSVLDPHIDYDPSYATRVIVPIFTNDDSFTVVWRRGRPEFYRLNEEGQAYFLNTGFRHGVANMGATDRITLMISLKSQEDLAQIPAMPDEWEKTVLHEV